MRRRVPAVGATTMQRVFLTNFAYHFGRVTEIQQLLDGPLAAAATAGAEAG